MGADSSLFCDFESVPHASPAFSPAVSAAACSPFDLLVPSGRPEGPSLVAERPDGSVIVFDRVQGEESFRVIRGAGGTTEVAPAMLYSSLAKDRVVESGFSTPGTEWLAGGAMRIPLVPASSEEGALEADLEHATVTVSTDPASLTSDIDAVFESGERLVPVRDCSSALDSLQIPLRALTHVVSASTPTGKVVSVFSVSQFAYPDGDLWQERILFFGQGTLRQVEVTAALQQRFGDFFVDFVSEGATHTVRFPASCEESQLPTGCEGELVLPSGGVEKLVPMPKDVAVTSLAYSCQIGWRTNREVIELLSSDSEPAVPRFEKEPEADLAVESPLESPLEACPNGHRGGTPRPRMSPRRWALVGSTPSNSVISCGSRSSR